MAAAIVAAAGCGTVGGGSSAPSANTGAAAPSEAASRVDAALEKAWADRGLVVAPEVDDATYLRRLSIDLMGRIPSVAELRAFEADPPADRRARAVDRMLASPEHASHLARTWERILLGPAVKNRLVDRAALRRWLEARFAADAPWDETVRLLLAAEGKSSLGGGRAEALVDEDPERARLEREQGVNGATNFLLRFARAPEDLAGTASRAFMGVQIQCAQCHDDKSEKWLQSDFRGLTASFVRVKIDPIEREKRAMPVFEITSIDRPAPRLRKSESLAVLAKVPPRALDGTPLDRGDPRQALGAWMTSPDNPWFSKAIVNRAWAEMIGQGLVEPVDDLAENNPPVMPELFAGLAEDFEKSGYDLDGLYRALALSRAYSRGVAQGSGTPRDQLFARAALEPLSADALLDSIFVATEVDQRIADRAPGRVAELKSRVRRRMEFVFDEDSESNGDGYSGTLQQALFTMNGGLPLAATAVADGSLLEGLLESSDDDTIIQELFLRTLSRAPTPDELAAARALVAAGGANDSAGGPAKRKNAKGKMKKKLGGDLAGDAVRSTADSPRERGFEDLFWSLLNSSELAFRR